MKVHTFAYYENEKYKGLLTAKEIEKECGISYQNVMPYSQRGTVYAKRYRFTYEGDIEVKKEKKKKKKKVKQKPQYFDVSKFTNEWKEMQKLFRVKV